MRPLQRLAAFSHAVGEGRFGQRTGLAQSEDEIGELAKNLDRMSESLQRADEEKDREARSSHRRCSITSRMASSLATPPAI